MGAVLKFNDVSERDMDLLFLEEFAASNEFLKIFTSKVDLINAEVVEVEHSKTDIQYGESDITVIVDLNSKRYGLLIENKIDAIAMPEQCKRYDKRGNLGKEEGDYEDFFVFIVAPKKYLENNKEAQNYPYQVSYEECKKYFEANDNRKKFKLSQIETAIEKQKTGYQVIENKRVTEFWNKYISYQKEKYPQLLLTSKEGAKGSKATWAHFNTSIPRLNIVHKMNKGFVDLEIPNAVEQLAKIECSLSEMIDIKKHGITFHKASKSLALRKIVPTLDVTQPFEIQVENIDSCLKNVDELFCLVKKLNERFKRLVCRF